MRKIEGESAVAWALRALYRGVEHLDYTEDRVWNVQLEVYDSAPVDVV